MMITLSAWLLSFALWLNPHLLTKVEDAAWVQGCDYNVNFFKASEEPAYQIMETILKDNCELGRITRGFK